MSRGIKDLRQMISVSRSSNDSVHSDEDLRIAGDSVNIKLKMHDEISNESDSGCLSNTSNEIYSECKKNTKRKTKQRKRRNKTLSNNSLVSNTSYLSMIINSTFANDVLVGNKRNESIERMLDSLCKSHIITWLSISNDILLKLKNICRSEYIHFSHFWLTKFKNSSKSEIYQLEYGILLDELKAAFTNKLELQNITTTDISNLLNVVFKEYPHKFVGDGNFVFLDYLDVLSSDRTDEYKKILSDIDFSCSHPKYVKLLLSMRAFALLSMFYAIVKFYTRVEKPCIKESNNSQSYTQRFSQAIRFGYTEVVEYMLKRKYVNGSDFDLQGRSWIFQAVSHNQLNVLRLLLTQVSACSVINKQSSSGNSALHAAVNSENLQMLLMLLQCPGVDVNISNTTCDGATPLHLAIMHNNHEMAAALLDGGADTRMNLSDQTTEDIANMFASDELKVTLQNHAHRT